MVGPIRRFIGRTIRRLLRWRIEGAPPDLPKFVLIGAPHTSNWDGILMYAVAWEVGLSVHFVGKHTLFRGPFGPLLRALGGVSVDRRSPHHAVRQLVDEFARRERFVLIIAPEGTRRKVERWKSGFYWIAREARVPIALGFLDYRRRVAGFGPLLHPSEHLEDDIARIHAFYADKVGRRPEQFTNIVFGPRDHTRLPRARSNESPVGPPSR